MHHKELYFFPIVFAYYILVFTCYMLVFPLSRKILQKCIKYTKYIKYIKK